jgi:hypothetical protein
MFHCFTIVKSLGMLAFQVKLARGDALVFRAWKKLPFTFHIKCNASPPLPDRNVPLRSVSVPPPEIGKGVRNLSEVHSSRLSPRMEFSGRTPIVAVPQVGGLDHRYTRCAA